MIEAAIWTLLKKAAREGDTEQSIKRAKFLQVYRDAVEDGLKDETLVDDIRNRRSGASRILSILEENPDTIISPDEIIEKIYGPQPTQTARRVISMTIQKLRKNGHPIETIRGQGYRMNQKS